MPRYNERHGGPYDRGGADKWYRRPARPHYYAGATRLSARVEEKDMTASEVEAYLAGYREGVKED